jgi:hypothetical protein
MVILRDAEVISMPDGCEALAREEQSGNDL